MLVADLQQTICAECGCYFGVPAGFLNNRQEDKRSFYCPNGHVLSYRQSESEKLRLERDRLKQQMARLEDEKREEMERANKAEAATKRLKKRTAAGTCPCCQRTFSNMGTHMRKQHPAFVAENVVPLKRA